MTGHDPAAMIAGVDTHKDTHYAAVITQTGQHLAAAQFPTTDAGYRALTVFISGFGHVDRVGMEGTSSYGAGLARYLAAAGLTVVGVLRPARQARRRGKSDRIDAYQAAHTALAGLGCSTPKSSDGAVEAIRMVLVARSSAVKARTEALAQVSTLIVSAPAPLRTEYRSLPTTRLIAVLGRTRDRRDDDPVTATCRTVLRTLAKRITTLTDEITSHDAALRKLVAATNPALLQACGIGPVIAGRLLVTFGGNPGRVRDEAAFAMMCGVAPIPASSGKTSRYRLNRGGDRAANNALHDIAAVRLHADPATRAYTARRTTEGKTKKDIIRCLKRAIARQVYHLIVNPPEPIDPATLRALREAAGLTLQHAACDLGCSIQKLSYLERGLTQNRTAMIAYRDYLTTRDTFPDAA